MSNKYELSPAQQVRRLRGNEKWDDLWSMRGLLASTIERLERELTIQKGVVEMVYIPVRNLREDRDRYRAERDAFREALEVEKQQLSRERTQKHHQEGLASTGSGAAVSPIPQEEASSLSGASARPVIIAPDYWVDALKGIFGASARVVGESETKLRESVTS